MSLISEALKKARFQVVPKSVVPPASEVFSILPPAPGRTRSGRRWFAWSVVAVAIAVPLVAGPMILGTVRRVPQPINLIAPSPLASRPSPSASLNPTTSLPVVTPLPVVPRPLEIPPPAAVGEPLQRSYGVEHQKAVPLRVERKPEARVEGQTLRSVRAVEFPKPIETAEEQAHRLFDDAVAYQKGEAWEKAAEAYQAVLRADPFNLAAYNNLGLVRGRQGNLKVAIETFQKALSFDPNFDAARNNLATVFLATGQAGEAEKELNVILLHNPKDALAYANLGIVHKRMNQPMAAESAFRKALELDPTLPEPHYNLAVLLEAKGEAREAIRHYKRWVALVQIHNQELTKTVQEHLATLGSPGKTLN